MKRGYIKIINEEGKSPSVEAQLANNTLWMDKYSIAKMFNCFPQKVEANLRSIFKNGLLYEQDVTYNYRYTYKGVERQCLYYNMKVLIFLSYRIGTFETKIFREFINDAFREHLKKKDQATTIQNSLDCTALLQLTVNKSSIDCPTFTVPGFSISCLQHVSRFSAKQVSARRGKSTA
jgi:hypothetical protein